MAKKRKPKRFCEPCDRWVTQTECPQCGAPTRKQETTKTTRGRDDDRRTLPSDTEPESPLSERSH